MPDVKGIWGYTDEELRSNLSTERGQTLLHMEIVGAEAKEGNDGRPYLILPTTVVCGSYRDRRGPQIMLSLGEYSGETKEGRAFHISAEDAWTKVVKVVRSIHPEPLPGFDKPFEDVESLEALGGALIGAEFIATLVRKGEFDNITKSSALSNPPKGFMCECQTKGFSF